MNMKNVNIRGFIFNAVASCLLLSCTLSRAEVLDKVIVVVNDEVITQREFDKIFIPVQQSYEENFKGGELEKRLAETKEALLRQMIDTKIAISEAKKAKVEAKEEEVQKRVDQIKAYYPDEDTFLQALNERGTNLTEFTKEVSEQMLAQQVVEQEVSARIVVTPAEINDLYKENEEQFVTPRRMKVSTVMVRKGEDDEEGMRKIKDLKKRIEGGADISEVAKEYSEGPYAEKGGEIGYVVKGQLLPEMEEVIFSSDKGDLTKVVETRIGYHVFLVEEIEEPRKLELAEVSDFLRGEIFKKKFEKALMEWLEEKRKNAYIAYK
ncbi:MAG: peptidylprolyl isomerase [Candidatus Omnitrophica bacterium]|nr:peptidylprolyl isomerase [Candidatus Omnitrophota bacterium]MBU1127517.1 peptidylprolyl isomerase [Candidatus Omnitrophota bacterium]MBU1783809.1 peptidylprolyl isomerase [Candidatus Omnitrophota bacterium]